MVLNNMNPWIYASLILALLTTQVPSVAAFDRGTTAGSIQVMVENERGEGVSKALVYVSEGGRSQVYESGDKGAVNIDLQEGKYTISASMSEPEGDLMSRYASAEAHVGVVPNDSTSVILTLRSIDDPISAMSLSTLQKIGIADEISKYINN